MNQDSAEFLAMLGERNSFQTFDDSKQKRATLARVCHGRLEQHAAKLARLNDQGAGVFVMVNAGDGRGRKACNVTRIRSLFVDLDGSPLAPVENAPLPPHCIVESSPGRWHAYWLVADCPPNQFKALQQSLAARFAGDRSVCNLPRVMRIPGFWHRKGEPFLSKVHALRNWPPRTLEEIQTTLSLAIVSNERQGLPAVIPEGQRNAALFTAAQGLAKRGHASSGVRQRLMTINAERCAPPLPATEIETIAARAMVYGSTGFVALPHKLLDSPKWKALHPAAQAVVVEAFRRYNGANNGALSLSWTDFQGRQGFGKDRTLHAARSAAVAAGFLIQTQAAKLTQTGRTPALFAIPDEWLHFPLTPKMGVSANPQNGRLIVDVQLSDDDVPDTVVAMKRATR